MPQIDIQRTHHLGHAGARAVVEHVAERMREEFQVEIRWDGDTLHFRRSGIDGHMDIGDHEVRVRARIGMLLAPLKPTLEAEIARRLDRYLEQARAG